MGGVSRPAGCLSPYPNVCLPSTTSASLEHRCSKHKLVRLCSICASTNSSTVLNCTKSLPVQLPHSGSSGLAEHTLVLESGTTISRNYTFIELIHLIQWTIAYPVSADQPAKRQKKTSSVSTSWPVRSTVHSPDGASYFLPV